VPKFPTRHRTAAVATTLLAAALAGSGVALATSGTAAAAPALSVANNSSNTTTPIKHVVVIFDENISFDHYFATYPNAKNTDGTAFRALPGTPKADNLANAHLLVNNPNTYQPARLTPAQALTCDQNHNYLPEQKAADGGKNDLFVLNTNVDNCTGLYTQPGLVMDYYDGNTVTAMWNYAQYFAMNDNSYDSTFGPSTPGALNLISGQTHGAIAVTSVTGAQTSDSYAVVSPDATTGVGTIINDPDPAFDDCSDKNHTSTNNLAVMQGKNIGDLLNAKGVTWGWFQGGFKPTTAYAGAGTYAVCGASHNNIGGANVVDYSPHHSPFEYYQSTSNPHHLAPSSVSMIGKTDQANHNYDLTDFDASIKAGNLPAVSFLKAPEYQDGHAAYSDPIDEQHFLVQEINEIQNSKFWKDTAIVLAYDDSDGWYDHKSTTLLNGSADAALNDTACQKAATTKGVAGGYADRCGPGTRQPLLVISPYSKVNYIDHTTTEASSITKFIEDNWATGRVGDASFDARAGSLTNMFSWKTPIGRSVKLKSTGAVSSIKITCLPFPFGGIPVC
jgi:phospholipase C